MQYIGPLYSLACDVGIEIYYYALLYIFIAHLYTFLWYDFIDIYLTQFPGENVKLCRSDFIIPCDSGEGI